jgi:DNA-binding transcriptional LysR family regulator
MEAAALRFSSGQGDAGGLVRISILESLAERLCPVFVKLQEMQPNLQLSISTETRFVDLVKEKVDVALRLARPVRNGEGLRIRKIGVLETDVYAHPAYIGRHGASETQDVCHRILDINTSFFHQDHDFVLSDPDWELFGIKGEVIFSSHSFSVLARMCALGHGVAILPNIIAETFPELRRLNADSLGVPLELWMISRLDLRAKWQKAMAGLLREEMATWRKS